MSAGTMAAARGVLRRWAGPAMMISLTAGFGALAPTQQAALASTATISGSSAVTGPIVSGYRTTVCIDDSGDSTANNTNLVTFTCNGSPEQEWTIETDGTIQINGKCMDIYREGIADKTPIHLYTCHGGANQQWQAVNGTLVNPRSGRCLDDPRFNVTDGTPLELFRCNGGANQQWELPTGPAT